MSFTTNARTYSANSGDPEAVLMKSSKYEAKPCMRKIYAQGYPNSPDITLQMLLFRTTWHRLVCETTVTTAL